MRPLFLFALWLCLLSPRASHSQSVPPVLPLVVTLDVGTVVHRPLIGLDTSYYRTVRLRVAQLETMPARVALLEHGEQLNSRSITQLQAALAACESHGARTRDEFSQLAQVNAVLAATPRRRPLLIEPRFYQGVFAGALGALVGGLLTGVITLK